MANVSRYGCNPATVPALPQTGLEVLPTRTIYTFAGEGVQPHVTFMTADLPEIDLLSRPVTYVTCEADTIDGKEHKVAIYLDAGSELAVNTPMKRLSIFKMPKSSGIKAWKVGSVEQPFCKEGGRRSDRLGLFLRRRLRWRESRRRPTPRVTRAVQSPNGTLPVVPPTRLAAKQRSQRLGDRLSEFGTVGAKPVSHWLILAYDDLYSIQYMRKNLRPVLAPQRLGGCRFLQASAKDYDSLEKTL